MAVEPQIATVTVTVSPGQLLGLTLCQVTNNVKDIDPGLIDDLNKERPGTVQIGDRITHVNGEEGQAFLLIRAFVGRLNDNPGTLRLTILRPIEFDVAIDLVEGKDLGMELMDIGFVQRVVSEGMVASHNEKAAACLLPGDRVVQISGREPSTEDGALGNVLPYLRLALCGGASPLVLRVRRGEMVPELENMQRKAGSLEVPPKPSSSEAKFPRPRIGYACFQTSSVFAARSMQALRRLGRPAPKAMAPASAKVEPSKVHQRSESKVHSEPATPSTRGPSSNHSQSSEVDLDFSLTLPGIVRRVA
jgi:hypothetical protein